MNRYDKNCLDNPSVNSNAYAVKHFKSVRWRNLPISILSIRGQLQVEFDPELSPKTIDKLRATEYGLCKAFYSSKTSTDKRDVRAILKDEYVAIGIISMCISEDENASFADFAARYAEARHEPFLVSAVALTRYLQNNGFFLYNVASQDGGYSQKKWVPVRWNELDSPEAAIKRKGAIKARTDVQVIRVGLPEKKEWRQAVNG